MRAVSILSRSVSIAVVTGAGSGIGRAIALELSSQGHEIIILEVDKAAGEESSSGSGKRVRKDTENSSREWRQQEYHRRMREKRRCYGADPGHVRKSGAPPSAYNWAMPPPASYKRKTYFGLKSDRFAHHANHVSVLIYECSYMSAHI